MLQQKVQELETETLEQKARLEVQSNSIAELEKTNTLTFEGIY
jgi:hypothetical protein